MDSIAIVGAGPAGLALAHGLATRGKRVVVYDHRAPWEKPCAGILGLGTIEENPLLGCYPYPVNWYHQFETYSPQDDKLILQSKRQFAVVSRRELGSYLLREAETAGVTFYRERVLRVVHESPGWSVVTEHGLRRTDVLVGADGAASLVRRTVVGKIPIAHLSVCCGYFLGGVPLDRGMFGFQDFEGYLWVVSCASHASAGAIARLGSVSPAVLFRRLDGFVARHLPETSVLQKWSALVPTPCTP
jgi:flavin-dependent dehydrogenase